MSTSIVYEPSLSLSLPLRPSQVSHTMEIKHVDVSSTYAVSSSGVVTLLNGLTRGTDETNRVGRHIMMTGVYARLSMLNAAANDTLRHIVLYDNQPNAALPAVTDVLEIASPLSDYNLNNEGRFDVLYDELYALRTVYNPLDVLEFDVCVPWETIFNAGNAGTVADMSTGSLLLLSIGSQAVSTTTETLYSRVCYVDK